MTLPERIFVQCKTHCGTHPKHLWRLELLLRLHVFHAIARRHDFKAHVFEQRVVLQDERGTELLQIEFRHTRIQVAARNRVSDIACEYFRLRLLRILSVEILSEHFAIHAVQEEAARELRVRWVALNHRAHHHDERALDVVCGDAFVELVLQLRDDSVDVDCVFVIDELRKRLPDRRLGERFESSVARRNLERVVLNLLEHFLLLLFANLRVLVAVDDVVLRYLEVSLLHQDELHAVLYVLDRRRVLREGLFHVGDDSHAHLAKLVV
jgi:hypothetical protein